MRNGTGSGNARPGAEGAPQIGTQPTDAPAPAAAAEATAAEATAAEATTAQATAAPVAEAPAAADSTPPVGVPRSRRALTALASPTARVLYWLAAIAYVPLLATRPGRISADTKQYLYLDPASLVRNAAYLWSPTESLGTVTHQNIGYLLPQGPYYWALHSLGVPMWVSQRLWTATVLFGAGAGIVYLCRTLRLGATAQLVASSIYMLTPYVLQYAEHLSALMLPWTGLGWMVALTIRATREGGIRHVAAFGIIVALVSSINATSMLYLAFAPLLWLPFALIWREAKLRRVIWVAAGFAIVSALVSAWWAVGLWVEARYGVDMLRYTETVPAVASTSTAAESLRGLGYWYFYAQDALGAIVPGSVAYQQWIWLIALSFALPTLGIVAALLIRWRERSYFCLLVVVGVAASVGTHPFTKPTPLGTQLEQFMTNTEPGMALRSTDRATPLVVLGLAMLAGAGAAALAARLPKIGVACALALTLAAVANQPALFDGNFVPSDLSRQAVPSYWYQAGTYLDGVHAGTRVLIVPGQDFADYVWGFTNDGVLEGLTTRPVAERVQVPYGTLPSIDLMDAFDNTVQDGVADPSAIAAIARLMSAGDVFVQSDLDYAHYLQPPPQSFWQELFDPTPKGLTGPVTFGPANPVLPVGRLPRWNEQTLTIPDAAPWPHAIAVFAVPGARPLVRAESAAAPVIVDGEGDGVVAAAATGLLDGNPTILYTGSYTGTPGALAKMVPPGAVLVLTDSNRLEGRRWGTQRDSTGFTQTLARTPSDVPAVVDYSNAPIDMFPAAGTKADSIAEQRGVVSVTASSYGNPVGYTPEDRPANAFDANPDTLWLTGGFAQPVGQWLRIDLGSPVTTNQVRLQQPELYNPDRWISQVRLSFDGGHSVIANLGDASRTKLGQVVSFPARAFRVLTVTITKVHATSPDAIGSVGFAEVGIPGRHVTEFIRPPVDMLGALGASSLSHRLVVILSRDRVGPFPPRTDPEINIQRDVALPTTRTFSLTGSVHLSALIPDELIDILTGRNASGDAAGTGVVARSQGRLPGDLGALAASAADGNPATAWEPGMGISGQLGTWVELDAPAPVTFDHMNLRVVADGHHSVPARITVSTEEGERTVDLPPIRDVPGGTGTVGVPVSFPALSGRRIRITVQAIRPEYTTDYYSGAAVVLPVAIAEAGIPGVAVNPLPAGIPAACRDDLLAIDGTRIWVRVSGTSANALAGKELTLRGCGPDTAGITLAAGDHTITTPAGSISGIDVDRLVLDSAAGGAAQKPAGPAEIPAAPAPAAPAHVTVVSQTPTQVHLRVTTDGKPFWLVFGESQDRGWVARITGGPSLGSSTLVDGYANGWLVHPAPGAHLLDVTLTFTPQRAVWAVLAVSGAAIAACVAIFAVPLKRRRRRARKAAGIESARAAGMTPPALAAPWRAPGRRAPILAALVAAAAAGAAAGFLVAPVYGAPVAVIALAAMEAGWMRWVITLGTGALAVALDLVVTIGQASAHHPAGSDWPGIFDRAGTIAWLTVIALLTDVVVLGARSIRRRSAKRTRGAHTAS